MSHTCSLEIVAAFSAHKCHIVVKKKQEKYREWVSKCGGHQVCLVVGRVTEQ